MAVPKVRMSRVRTRRRRSHDALQIPQWVNCAHCGHPTLPHRMCPSCKQYKGRQIFELSYEDED